MELNIEHLPEVANAAGAAVNVSADMPDIAMVAVAMTGASILLFLIFVLPVWLLLHYRSRAKHLVPPPAPQARTVSSEDLAELVRLAERIEHRLDAVETLMDAERPYWRK